MHSTHVKLPPPYDSLYQHVQKTQRSEQNVARAYSLVILAARQLVYVAALTLCL